tara:strand:+ start:559 stop:753 length:195 start_codon:yes stop_codon:yes gene_type:complete
MKKIWKEIKMKFDKDSRRAGLTEGETRELIDDIVRKAMREQARDLETHFKDVHRRLIALEKKRR